MSHGRYTHADDISFIENSLQLHLGNFVILLSLSNSMEKSPS